MPQLEIDLDLCRATSECSWRRAHRARGDSSTLTNRVIFLHAFVADACLQVLEMFGASIGLTPKHVLKIMAEADNNDNGVIEYAEFLPVATEIIQVRLGTRFSKAQNIPLGVSFAIICSRFIRALNDGIHSPFSFDLRCMHILSASYCSF